MSDIVERLTEAAAMRDELKERYWHRASSLKREAAAEITRLRQLLSEAEKREKEARAKALEEAAAYHDDLAAQHAASSKEERHHVARDKHAAFCIQHERHAAAIRALQSEER